MNVHMSDFAVLMLHGWVVYDLVVTVGGIEPLS
jgi:hypothetical protein